MHRGPFTATLALLALAGCTMMGQGAGDGAAQVEPMGELTLQSSAFDAGGRIPDRYGYTNENINPPLRIDGVPATADSLVLIVDDPDARKPAGKIWDHWVLFNIPPGTTAIDEDSVPSGAVEGVNDYGSTGYGGPNPPDREHTYRFRLYALDTGLSLDAGATAEQVEDAMDGHIVAQTVLNGTFAPEQT